MTREESPSRAKGAFWKAPGQERIANRILRVLLMSTDDAMYADVLDVVLEALESECGIFGYIDEEGALVCPSMTRGVWERCAVPGKSIVFPRESWGGLWGRALSESRSFYENGPHQVPEGHIPIHRSLHVPILYRGESIGILQVANRETDYGEEQRLVLESIASLLAPVLAARLQRDREEAERKRAMDMLRESEARFRQLTENIDDVFWIMSGDLRRFLYVSPAYERVWGRAVEGAYEDPRSWVEAIHPEDRERIRSALVQRGAAGEFDEEFRVVRPDGSIRWMRSRAFPIRDEAGEVYRIAGIATDFTERRHAREELARAKEAAEAASRAKSQFLANMSHEIRTPMTSVLGFVDLIAEYDLSAEERSRHIATIRRNGRHLVQVIDDILDISKVEAGELRIDLARCSPFALVEDVASLMRERATGKGLGFEVDFLGSIPETIETDATRVRQILMNLLSNAIKFTDSGGVRLVVTLVNSESSDGPHLSFEVIDTGIGIPEAEIESVFEPFAQVDGSARRKFGGSGLGLTISRRIAELLGGEIRVESAPGRGSRFVATIRTGSLEGIRIVKGPTEPRRADDESSHPAVPQSDRFEGRVLVADDVPDTRLLIKSLLERMNLRVEIAENGRIAYEKAKASLDAGEPFDAILMDLQMPEMDGYDAASKLRNNGYQEPIIAVTAHALIVEQDRAIAAGCDDVVVKPIEKEVLRAILEEYIAKRADRP